MKRNDNSSEETLNKMYRDDDAIFPRLKAAEEWQQRHQLQKDRFRAIIRKILVSGIIVSALGALIWYLVMGG